MIYKYHKDFTSEREYIEGRRIKFPLNYFGSIDYVFSLIFLSASNIYMASCWVKPPKGGGVPFCQWSILYLLMLGI